MNRDCFSIKRYLALLILALFSAAAGAQGGFDEDYEAYIGDYNSDGYQDIYIRQKPRIILLHGEIATPIVLPAPVAPFVLTQNSWGGFALQQALSPFSLSDWQSIELSIVLGDLNADGNRDLVLRNLDAFLGSGVNDQIVFSNSTGSVAETVTEIDLQFRLSYLDMWGGTTFNNYFDNTALYYGSYDYEQVGTISGYISGGYLQFYNLGYDVNGNFLPIVGDDEDPFDEDVEPEYCEYTFCAYSESSGVWMIYAENVPEYELTIDYSIFDSDDMDFVDSYKTAAVEGGLDCASSEAILIGQRMEALLGVPFMGGILESCAVLTSEIDYDPSNLARSRLSRLYSAIEHGYTTINVYDPETQGDPEQNAADLKEAEEYLSGSEMFQELYEWFKESEATLVVHRDHPSEYDDISKTVIWDPDMAVVTEEGVISPAVLLGHEIAHARHHLEFPERWELEDLKYEVVEDPDTGEVTFISPSGPNIEEERATDVEAQIAEELGEPARENYGDAIGTLETSSPTYSCKSGDALCDLIIIDAQAEN